MGSLSHREDDAELAIDEDDIDDDDKDKVRNWISYINIIFLKIFLSVFHMEHVKFVQNAITVESYYCFI